MSDLIAAHLAHLRAGDRSPHTVEDRWKVLTRLERDLPYGLDDMAAEEYVDWVNPAWSAQTKATYWRHTNGYFDWGVAASHYPVNPMRYVLCPRVPKGVPRPVTDAELDAALTLASGWVRTAVVLAAHAGLRASEIAAARREHFADGRIYIPLGKGGKPATLPMSSDIWSEVAPLPDGPLVTDLWGREVDGDWVSMTAARWFRRHGLPGVTLHRFRHKYGTDLSVAVDANGDQVNIRTVQTLMRHASLATTEIYIEVTGRQRRLAVDALPSLSPRPFPEAA